MSLDTQKLLAEIEAQWDADVVPKISEYIKIPNLSPMFDPDWEKKEDTDKAVKLMVDWANAQGIKGFNLEVFHFIHILHLKFSIITPFFFFFRLLKMQEKPLLFS